MILGEKHPSYIKLENRDFYNDGSCSTQNITIATRLDGSFDVQKLPARKTYITKLEDFSPTWDESNIQKIKDAKKPNLNHFQTFLMIFKIQVKDGYFFMLKKRVKKTSMG